MYLRKDIPAAKTDTADPHPSPPAAKQCGYCHLFQVLVQKNGNFAGSLPLARHAVTVKQLYVDFATGQFLSAQSIPRLPGQQHHHRADDLFPVAVLCQVLPEKKPSFIVCRGRNRSRVNAVQGIVQDVGPPAAEDAQLLPGQGRCLADPRKADFTETGVLPGSQSRQQGKGQGGKKCAFFTLGNNIFAAGFDKTAGHLGDQFIGADRPDGVKSQVFAQNLANAPTDIGPRPEKSVAAGYVHVQVSLAMGTFHQGAEREYAANTALDGLFIQFGPGR